MTIAVVSDKLFFYSKSRHVIPGKGAREVVLNPESYSALSEIKDWRKILSNFHESPFVWRGKNGTQLKTHFNLQRLSLLIKRRQIISGHVIGVGDGLVARKNRKLVVLDNVHIREWG